MPSVLHRQAEAGGHRWARRALRAPLRPARQEVLSPQEVRSGRAPSGRGVTEAERLGPLRAAKLRALVARHWAAEPRRDPVADALTGSLPGGATLLEGGTGRAWVLIDGGGGAVSSDSPGLGPALVWAGRHDVRVLDVLVDDGAAAPGTGPPATIPTSAVIARRAAEWSDPPTVWKVEGHDLVPAVAAPLPPPFPLPPDHLGFVELLRDHGADPVVEHGVLRGEVLGLEVARVVAGDGGWHVEVGVGRLDRLARAEMRPGEPDATAIDEVVRVVRTWRRAGAPRHPANTLSRERWLRSVVVAHPAWVGAAELHPVGPPVPRPGLRQGAPAAAAGVAADGTPMIVVCSTGVDVDLVPTAADTRSLRDGPHASTRLVIVMPEGDDYPLTRSLAAALLHPAEVVAVRRDWAAQTG